MKLPTRVEELSRDHVAVALNHLDDKVRPMAIPHPMAKRVIELLWAWRRSVLEPKTKQYPHLIGSGRQFGSIPEGAGIRLATSEPTPAMRFEEAARVFETYANDQLGSKRWQNTKEGKALCDTKAEIWNQAASELRDFAALLGGS